MRAFCIFRRPHVHLFLFRTRQLIHGAGRPDMIKVDPNLATALQGMRLNWQHHDGEHSLTCWQGKKAQTINY